MHPKTSVEAITRICSARADGVEVRGKDLCRDLMGRLSFTEYFHLLLTGREPTEDQRFFLDLLLVAIAEHGMMPTVQAARMTLAADPGFAAGRACRRSSRLRPGDARHGRTRAAGCCWRPQAQGCLPGRAQRPRRLRLVQAFATRAARFRASAIPVHRPTDPRAERILELADARQVSGPQCRHGAAASRCGRQGLGKAAGDERLDADRRGAARPRLSALPMVKAIPLLARTRGNSRPPRRRTGESRSAS